MWVYSCILVCVFLQLCPEDDGEHGEPDSSSQSQVRVEEQGEDEGDHPDQLEIERERKTVVNKTSLASLHVALVTHEKPKHWILFYH